MTRSLRLMLAFSAFSVGSVTPLQAQSSPPPATRQPPAQEPADASRPATTTFFGDTGLWFVPTAEVLGQGKWSVSGYRRGTNWVQGYTNVADFAGTFAVGIKDRAELFGSFLVDTRIDRDLRPVFVDDRAFGGVVDRYPRVNQYWTGDSLGDFYLGAKVNVRSERAHDPIAFAVRGIVKLPTGDRDVGASTGKTDVALDAILSKEIGGKTEVSGYAGYEFRGAPDGFDAPGGAFRWGGGVGYPSRHPVRLTGELNGLIPSAGAATVTGSSIVAIDSTLSPAVSDTEAITRATVGVTFQKRSGLFFGAGFSWNLPGHARNTAFSEGGDEPAGDYFDWQFRIGYHPGVKTYVAAAPPPPAPPPEPAPAVAPQNRPPAVTAVCDPGTVEVGNGCRLTASGQDPDGDPLTYRWSAPIGTLANPAERSTLWTAPNQEGAVPITVAANDGKGGTASATVTVQVTRPPVRTYTFEDVHFDFDRYSLRPEATRILDEAVSAMRQDQALRLTVEGHTCNIGTAEYNLALGNRRATAVRDYLVSRGVAADRLNTVSYGEERPKYDNVREETRRLNRRAALTVRLQ